MFFLVATFLAEQYFLHNPNAWYSHLKKVAWYFEIALVTEAAVTGW